MKLIFKGWFIALKQSAGAVCAIFGCLFLFLTAVAMLIPTVPQPEPIKIAVVCPEDSSLAASLITAMVDTRYEGLATLKLLPTDAKTEGYGAVITLPQGFWRSIMTGENLSPTVVINVSSPIEGLWVRQLAESAARTLSHAQNAMGGLITVYAAQGLAPEEISRRIFEANLSLMESFLERKGRFEGQTLSATGSVSATEYYGGSAVAFLLFTLLFLLFEPLHTLRRFGAFSGYRGKTFAACLLAAFSLALPLSAFGAVVLGRGSIKSVGDLLLLALLLAALLTACAGMFNSLASCAAAVSGLALFQALFGGGLLPEALLPPSLGALCRLLPLSLLRRLTTGAALGVGFSDYAVVFFWCLLLFSAAFLGWNRKEAA